MLYWYLLAGLILGSVCMLYELWNSSSRERLYLACEMLVVTVIGTISFLLIADIGFLSALSIALIFTLINQVPKWWVRTLHGDAIVDFVAMIPPTIIFVVLVDGWAWYGALCAVAELLPSPVVLIDGSMGLAVIYAFVTFVTGGIAYASKYSTR